MGDSSASPPVRNLPQWDSRWARAASARQDELAGVGLPSVAASRWRCAGSPRTTRPPRAPSSFPRRMGRRSIPPSTGCGCARPSGRTSAARCNAVNNNGRSRPGLMNKAAAALGIDPKGVLGREGETASRRSRTPLAKGPIVVNMTHPGHFVVITGFAGGKLQITDPGNELCKQAGTQTGIAQPDNSQWPGGKAPAKGNEYDKRAYVAIDPTAFVKAKNDDTGWSRLTFKLMETDHHRGSRSRRRPRIRPRTTTTAPAEPPPPRPANGTGRRKPETCDDRRAGQWNRARTRDPRRPPRRPNGTGGRAAARDDDHRARRQRDWVWTRDASTTAAPRTATPTAAPVGTTTEAPANGTGAGQEATTTAGALREPDDRAPATSTTAAPTTSTTAPPPSTSTTAPPSTTTANDAVARRSRASTMCATADELLPWDQEGNEGRWLDVPRLQQQNDDAPSQSSYWSGRAAGAMIYNFYSKVAKKTDEYIGHANGDVEPGPNGIKTNLRWLGGSNKGVLAGITDRPRRPDAGVHRFQPAVRRRAARPATIRPAFPIWPRSTSRPSSSSSKSTTRCCSSRCSRAGPATSSSSPATSSPPPAISGSASPTRTGPAKTTCPASSRSPTRSRPTRCSRSTGSRRRRSSSRTRPSRTQRLYDYVGNPGKYMFIVPGDADHRRRRAGASPHAEGHAARRNGRRRWHRRRHRRWNWRGRRDRRRRAARVARPMGQAAAPATAPRRGRGTWSSPKSSRATSRTPASTRTASSPTSICKACSSTTARPTRSIPPAMGDARRERRAPRAATSRSPATTRCRPGIGPGASNVAQRPKWDTFCSGALADRRGVFALVLPRSVQAEERGLSALGRRIFRELVEVERQRNVARHGRAERDLLRRGFVARVYACARGRGLDRAGDQRHASGRSSASLGNLKTLQPAPGDVLSIVSPGTPRTVHVVTVILPLTTSWDSGSIWVVSGNCGPRGNVAVDSINLEARDPSFNPYKTDDDGKVIGQWQASDKKPSAGRVWVYADQLCSALMPDQGSESMERQPI